MDYVVGVLAPAYRISDSEFATESAFGAHLKTLKATMEPEFTRLVLIAPQMSEEQYRDQKAQLAHITSAEGIALVVAPPLNTSVAQFWLKELPRTWRPTWRAIKNAGLYHTGLSDDIFRPHLALTNLAAWVLRRPTAFFVDIDHRRSTERNYKLGLWSRGSYLRNLLFHDPLRWLQVWHATRFFDLNFLKSRSMVEDFGRGRPNVKCFLDTAHSPDAVLTKDETAARLARVSQPNVPLYVTYFGRMVGYKGLNYTLESIAEARKAGADVRLRLIGSGPDIESLKQQAHDLAIADHVDFLPPRPYGNELFALLDQQDVAIFTPKLEDTPRAAIDAMARGLPLVAFDIEYFQYLSELSGAVALGAWTSPASIGEQLVRLHRDRQLLAQLSERAVAFAAANTQEQWLERRAAWTRHFCLGAPLPEALRHDPSTAQTAASFGG